MPSTQFDDPRGTWNQRYAGDGFVFGSEPNQWLRDHAALFQPGDRVLAVADGEGRNSVWLAGRGAIVDAFDVSDVGVEKARRHASSSGVNVNYSISDADRYPWPVDTYDAVVAIFVQFADPPMRARMFDNMQRALKPGGVLLLQGYTPKQLDYRTGGPPEVSHLYTEAMLRDAFAGLEIVELDVYEAELNEGSRHRGPSALVGMVARRR